jgi:hypothetical protein
MVGLTDAQRVGAMGPRCITRPRAAGVIYQATLHRELHQSMGFEWAPVDPTTGMAELAGARVLFEGEYLREHVTHGYALTVHSAEGVTADTTHAVLGENTTRAMLYVAMTRGRETNIAYIYERATEQEYGLDQLQGAHVMGRPNSDHAGRLLRAIIANHDQPVTVHDIAAQTPSAAMPQRVRRIHDRRAAAVQCRRATYQIWQADAESFARATTTARERRSNHSRDHSRDYGIETYQRSVGAAEFSAARTCVRSFLTGVEGLDGLKGPTLSWLGSTSVAWLTALRVDARPADRATVAMRPRFMT